MALPATTLTAIVGAHVQQLRSLQAAIEHHIAARVVTYSRIRLLARLPGASTINLAQLLAEVGRILDRATSADQTASECGTAPGHPRLRHDHRRLLPQGSQHPRPQSHHRLRAQRPDAITLRGEALADARARGKRNPHAIRIVARAWIRVIWGLLAHQRPIRPRRPATLTG